jgi:hypothetical protein
MATEPVTTEQPLEASEAFEEEARREGVHGLGPWKLGLRRLRRNKVALFFGALFVLLVAACVAAPLWADQLAHTGPNENHLTDTVVVDGQERDVVALDGVPITSSSARITVGLLAGYFRGKTDSTIDSTVVMSAAAIPITCGPSRW